MHGVRNARVESHAGRIMLGGWWAGIVRAHRRVQGHAWQGDGRNATSGGVQGHRGIHGLRDGRGVGYRGHGDAGMQGNAFMEDGAGKVDAREN